MKYSVKLSVKGFFFIKYFDSLFLVQKKVKIIVTCQLKDLFYYSILPHETELLVICSPLWIGHKAKKPVKNSRLSFYILFWVDSVVCPPSHAKTWLLAVEKVSFVEHSRETWPPLYVMWRRVRCENITGGVWAVNSRCGGDLPCHSCLPFTIHGWLKGPCPGIMTTEVD